MYKLFLIAIIFLITACSGKNEHLPKIGIIQLIQEPQLDRATDGIIEGLKASGFFDGQNIKIIKTNAQGEIINIPQILKSLENENIKLLITNTTPCMVGAAQLIKKIPVVFTVAFSPIDAGITNPPANLYGYYDPFNLEPFIELIRECIPGIKKIGMPYNPTEVNAVFALNKIKEMCVKYNIEVAEMPVSSVNDISMAAPALAEKKIEAFVVSADNTVNSGIFGLLKTAKNFKIPIFVTDPPVVESGATIGFGINYYEWGLQSGKLAGDILNGNIPNNQKLIPYTNYKLWINKKSCEEHNFSVPDSVIEKADRIL